MKNDDSETQKDRNFALLCIHLHHFGRDGSAGKILLEFSATGLQDDIACRRWKRFSKSKEGRVGSLYEITPAKSRTSFCGGPDSCHMKPAPTCTFYYRNDGKNFVAGKGMVYPRSTYYKGGLIPSYCTLVRFRDVNPSRHFDHCITSTPVLWKRNAIGRVSLFGPRRTVVGTAILVSKTPLRESPNSTSSRTNSRNIASIDISRVIIVHDFKLHEAVSAEAIPYPYRDWYTLPPLKTLVPLHFSHHKIPVTLQETTAKNVVEFLWDAQEIDESSETP